MPRPSRAEFSGALYHLTLHAAGASPLFVDDLDRRRFLSSLRVAVRRYQATCFGYCLMDTHVHLVLQTWRPNLARMMGTLHLRRAERAGCEFDSMLVERSGYLLEACRYVDLNPVRAGLVRAPSDWPWSSYRAHAGFDPPPRWLNSAALHRQLGTPIPWRNGATLYAAYVAAAGSIAV